MKRLKGKRRGGGDEIEEEEGEEGEEKEGEEE